MDEISEVPRSKLAIASFVLGLFPLIIFFLGFIFEFFNIINFNSVGLILKLLFMIFGILASLIGPSSLLAIILGIVSIVQIKKQVMRGKGLAVSGILLGILDVIIQVLLIIVLLNAWK